MKWWCRFLLFYYHNGDDFAYCWLRAGVKRNGSIITWMATTMAHSKAAELNMNWGFPRPTACFLVLDDGDEAKQQHLAMGKWGIKLLQEIILRIPLPFPPKLKHGNGLLDEMKRKQPEWEIVDLSLVAGWRVLKEGRARQITRLINNISYCLALYVGWAEHVKLPHFYLIVSVVILHCGEFICAILVHCFHKSAHSNNWEQDCI